MSEDYTQETTPTPDEYNRRYNELMSSYNKMSESMKLMVQERYKYIDAITSPNFLTALYNYFDNEPSIKLLNSNQKELQKAALNVATAVQELVKSTPETKRGGGDENIYILDEEDEFK